MKNKKALKILRVILFALGLLFVVYSGILLSMNNFNLGLSLIHIYNTE